MAERNGAKGLARRTFLAGTAAATFTVMKPSLVRGTEANSTIELGMIGCGGRGNWIGDRFVKNGKYKFVACADYYQDKVDSFGKRFSVGPARRYTTLSAYRKLLEGKLDAVVIETPPCFHPEHAAAAVEAGRHVFLAKPIAVDVPGCLSILESGKKATANKLVYLIDFQTRANEFYREAARRVHNGALGRIVCAEARYPWHGGNFSGPEKPEDRLRRWYCFKEISGDFIVEQSIHALDVATWFINADPISATGTGGTKGLRSYGNIWDHFNVIYTFPKDVVLSFYSVQAVPKAPNEIACRIFGSKGIVDTDYYRHAWIRGENRYEGGECPDLFDAGAVTNIKEFYQFVTKGDCSNITVAPSVRSNLAAVLGRTCAYKGGVVTWDEMIKAGERMKPDLTGLKS